MPRIRWLTAIVWCAWAVSAAQATELVWDALRTPDAVVIPRKARPR